VHCFADLAAEAAIAALSDWPVLCHFFSLERREKRSRVSLPLPDVARILRKIRGLGGAEIAVNHAAGWNKKNCEGGAFWGSE
jgi:hypothetical protein